MAGVQLDEQTARRVLRATQIVESWVAGERSRNAGAGGHTQQMCLARCTDATADDDGLYPAEIVRSDPDEVDGYEALAEVRLEMPNGETPEEDVVYGVRPAGTNPDGSFRRYTVLRGAPAGIHVGYREFDGDLISDVADISKVKTDTTAGNPLYGETSDGTFTILIKDATGSRGGYVTTADQTFAGNKQFQGTVTVQGGTLTVSSLATGGTIQVGVGEDFSSGYNLTISGSGAGWIGDAAGPRMFVSQTAIYVGSHTSLGSRPAILVRDVDGDYHATGSGTVNGLTFISGFYISGSVSPPSTVSDGNKGDITVTGGSWALNAGVVDTDELADLGVTNGKLATDALDGGVWA